MNIQNVFLSKRFGGAFYHAARKLLNEANINTNQTHHKTNTPIKIKARVAICLEDEKTMGDLHEDASRIHINFTTMNDKDDEYEEEIRSEEELNRKEV